MITFFQTAWKKVPSSTKKVVTTTPSKQTVYNCKGSLTIHNILLHIMEIGKCSCLDKGEISLVHCTYLLCMGARNCQRASLVIDHQTSNKYSGEITKRIRKFMKLKGLSVKSERQKSKVTRTAAVKFLLSLVIMMMIFKER